MTEATTNYSYHRIIRKRVVAFGNMFNEIKLARYDSTGNETEHFLVPIVYGGKEKYVSRLEGDPELDKKVQISLPIMSFEMNDMRYDASRKLNTNAKTHAHSGKTNTDLSVYNPVPFDFDFKLYAYVRNIEDGAQLMEKILPFFTPDYTLRINLIPEMGIVKQLPIVLKDVSNEIDYEGDYNSKVRSVIWTLSFTVKGYLYGAISNSRIIRASYTNIINDPTLHNYNLISKMNSNGFGDYLYDEEVYQGYSYDTATARAKVNSWSSVSKMLEMKQITGHFTSGETIIGAYSNATWTANTFNVSSNSSVQIIVTPVPSDVIFPNNYTYNVQTKEFPNIEETVIVSFDSTYYDFSSTEFTMDRT